MKCGVGSFLVCLLLFTSSAHAISVGLNFRRSSGESLLGAAEVAGVPSVAQANWNNTDGSTTGTTANVLGGVLVDSEGNNQPGLSVAWQANGTFSTGNSSNSDERLMNGYIDNTATGGNNDTFVTFTGVPVNSQLSTGEFVLGYDVYVYFGSDGNDRTGAVSDGTTTFFFNTHTNAATFNGPGDYLQTTDTTGPIANGPDANYAIFEGLTAPSFTIDHIRGSNNSGFLAIQIVFDAAFIPEPSSFALVGLSLVGLGRIRRRKRLRSRPC